MKRLPVTLTIIALIVTLTLVVEYRAEQDIQVSDIEIDVGTRQLSALYSTPEGVHEVNSLPAVAVFHGFTANKEMMRPFTEGLARVGFAVITVDQQGHGQSTGLLREDGDNSLRNDGVAVIDYLRQIPEVDANRVAILGHSMGAGTAISTSVFLGDLQATVLLGNSLSNIDEYNVNSTFPSNSFLGIGEYDELFSVEETINNFGEFIDEDPEANRLYGSFQAGTARELLVTPTDHILEVINPELVERSIEWMYKSLVNPDTDLEDPELESVDGWGYVLDQLLSALSGLMMLALIPIAFLWLPQLQREEGTEINWFSHGLIAFSTFIISIPMAFIISSSFAGLFVTWFILGFIFYSMKISRNFDGNTKEMLRQMFVIRKDTYFSLLLLGGLMIITHLILLAVHWDFRFVLPLLSVLSLRRLGLFFVIFIPGCIFFTAEISSLGGRPEFTVSQLGKEILARIWTFSLLLIVHYLPIVFFGTSILPSLVGFLAFFIVGLLPVMTILSVFSTLGRNRAWSPLAIAILSSGLIAWMLASTLSFNP